MALRKPIYRDVKTYVEMNDTTDVIKVYGYSGNGAALTDVDAAKLNGLASDQFLRSDVADVAGAAITWRDFDGVKVVVRATAVDEATKNVRIVDIQSSAGTSIASIDSEGDVKCRFLTVDGVIGAAELILSGPLTVSGAVALGNGNDVVNINAGSGNFVLRAANVILSADGSLVVLGDVSGVTIGGIPKANLVDKNAVTSIAGAWTFNDINLNNLFKINGIATSANVTAANLDTLTSGANADALHTHTGPVALTRSFTAEVAIAAGKCVRVGSGNNTANLANAGTEATAMAIGFAETAGGVGETIIVKYAGVVTGVLTGATPGQDVFVAITDGDVTTSFPSAPSFKVSYKVGRAINANDFLIEKGIPIVLV